MAYRHWMEAQLIKHSVVEVNVSQQHVTGKKKTNHAPSLKHVFNKILLCLVNQLCKSQLHLFRPTTS